MSDTNELVERLRYVVENPSAWEAGFDQRISDLIAKAVAALAPVEAVPVVPVSDELGADIIFTTMILLRGQPFIDTQIEEVMQECRAVWSQVQESLALSPAHNSPLAHPPAQAGAVTEAMVDVARKEFQKHGWGYRDDDIRAALTAALGAQTPPEGAVTFYDQNNCPVCHGIPDYFGSLVDRARDAAAKASTKFPQPNYVTLKIAEEAGEVVRGAVHYAENRMEWKEVEGEIVQLLAMLIRFVTEGDQINGITPPVNQSEGADRG